MRNKSLSAEKRASLKRQYQVRRCKRILLDHGNLPDAKRAAIKRRFYVQASVWETALGKLINQRRTMNGTETTGTAPAQDTQETQTTAVDQADGAQTEAQVETTEEAKAEEPARTGAAAEADRAAVAFFVTYIAGDDDVSHGVNAAGIDLAAIIVKVNEDKTVNLHGFAPDSAATLFKQNVSFGNLPGQCHF